MNKTTRTATGGTVPCLERDPADDGGEFDLPYQCTRERGHDGAHAAVDGHNDVVLHTWDQHLAPKVTGRVVTLLAVELLNNGHRLDSYRLHCIAEALGTSLSDVVRTAELIRADR